MKILHAGNMANLAYITAKLLRKEDLDIDLLIEKNPPKTSDPILLDPEIHNEYPTWFRFFDKTKTGWKMNLIKIMREKKYDLIHAYVELPMFSYVANRPFIAHTQGSDLRELAFSNSIRGRILRRAYKKAKATIFYQPDYLPLLPKLKISNAIFLPPYWESSFYKPNNVSKNEYENKFLIFHPTGLVWRLKGNDVFFKAFAKYVKTDPEAFLIIVDRSIDSKRTHNLIEKLDISNKVKFIQGPLNSSELLHYYNLADVVADQFIIGSLGSIGWEVFSCEKPLIAYIKEDYYKKLYGESPPLVNAKNENEIFDSLQYLKDRKIRTNLGQSARKWITKYHSAKTYSKKLTDIYNHIYNKEPLDEYFINYD